MNKINANTIIKNLTGIFCGAIILCLLLPFLSTESSASVGGIEGSSEAQIYTGIQILTDGGFMGILLVVCPVLILVANYLPQIEKYKKIISMGLSAICIVILFIIPGQIAALSNSGAEAVGQMASAATSKSSSVDIKTNYMIGFWLILILLVGIAVLSAIQFFNLKGNKVFDAVNSDNSNDNIDSANMPQINLEKVTEFAKNTANAVSAQVKNVANNIPKGETNNTQESAYAQKDNTVSANNQPVSYQSAGNTEQAEPHNFGMLKKTQKPVAPTPKENPEVIMNLIKQLFEMKESGILTEEEFSEKKQELLNKM